MNDPGLLAERQRLAVALVAVTAAGFASKLYQGPGDGWFNDSLAGLFYVVFWCLAAAICLPTAPADDAGAAPKGVSPGRIALTVLALTCALEVLQLYHPPFLQRLRGTFAGAALLGTTFVASDFVYYVIGAAIGWLGIRWLR